MILIDEVKYSCVECIRGHRSSLCYHHTRPLLQVRSKGRPNVYANGNPNHRIAVFAEEVDASAIESKSCKTNPVIILKASPKQVIDLITGQIVGPYSETNTKPDASSRPPTPKICSESFINTSTCCSGSITKKKCCCDTNKMGVNKSKILKTYLKKHMKEKSFSNLSSGAISNSVIASLKSNSNYDSKRTVTSEMPKKEPEINELWNFDQQVYDVVSVPSCSVAGFCGCGEGCNCVGCAIHGKGNAKSSRPDISSKKNDNIIGTATLSQNFDYNQFNNPAKTTHSNLVFTTVPSGQYESLFSFGNSTDSGNSSYSMNDSGTGYSLTVPTSNGIVVSTYGNTTPSNGFIDSTSNAVTNGFANSPANEFTHNSNPANGPVNNLPSSRNSESARISNPVSSYSTSNYFTSLIHTDDDSPSNDDCVCPAEGCECTNCETHGIINGFKLDEFFQNSGTSNLEDAKLISLMNEFQNVPVLNGELGSTISGNVSMEASSSTADTQNIQVKQEILLSPETASKSCCL